MASEIITLTAAGKKFWGTKKTKARVTVTDKPVRCYGAYWSGGSKNEWWTCNHQGRTNHIDSVGPAPFDTRPEPEVAPTADIAVVQGGICNGKTSSLGIYVTSKDGWTW